MRLALLLLTTLTMTTATAQAGELEIYAGANSTTYDNASDANTWGIGLRVQYNLTSEDNTWFANLNAPGISLVAGQVHAGYLWRSKGDFFWEGGLAAGYSLIYGPDGTLIGGIGYHVTQGFFFDFPIYAGTTGISLLPYFGFEF